MSPVNEGPEREDWIDDLSKQMGRVGSRKIVVDPLCVDICDV